MKKIPSRTIFFSSGILTLNTSDKGMSMITMPENIFKDALVMRWLIITEQWAVLSVNPVRGVLGELTAVSRDGPILLERPTPYGEPQDLHHKLAAKRVSTQVIEAQDQYSGTYVANRNVNRHSLHSEVQGQKLSAIMSAFDTIVSSPWNAHVMRPYMINKQAFNSQIVVMCICSTTMVSFEPYMRSRISSGSKSIQFSPEAMRLLLVLMMWRKAIRMVRVICAMLFCDFEYEKLIHWTRKARSDHAGQTLSWRRSRTLRSVKCAYGEVSATRKRLYLP